MSGVYREKIVIPTYRLLGEDINPIFESRLEAYPYSYRIFRENVCRDTEYEAVILENRYLKATVIPSLGGRLFGMLDKRSGREVFYRNRVVKPRMIARRGAWFSGGVEFNFPISHSPTTMDRVNYRTREYPDGSAAVEFGNVELISGMEWKVELKLHPDRACLEQQVRLFNPTSRANRFYFWTNAAVAYTDHLRLIYPFDWGTNNNSGRYEKWPWFENFDASRPRDIPYSFETFGKRRKENFFGVYDTVLDAGVAHYADRKTVKGAKFFIWGNDRRAEAWNRALTDDGTEYIEIQSGPFESQNVYRHLRPYQELCWKEYWIPVFGTGGFRHVEKDVAANLEWTEGKLAVSLLAVRPLPGCLLVFKAAGREKQYSLDLSPSRVERLAVELDREQALYPGQDLRMDIYCGGAHVFSLGGREESADEYPDHSLYEDTRVFKVPDREKNDFDAGMYHELWCQWTQALERYLKNLERYPGCPRTCCAIGRIRLKQGLYGEAAEFFTRALKSDNLCGEARFNLAAAEKMRGNRLKARRLYMDISPDSEYFKASAIELIKLDLVLGYFQDAQNHLDNGALPQNPYGAWLASVCMRLGGDGARAKATLLSVEAPDGLVLSEQYLQNPGETSGEAFLSYIGNDGNAILQAALQYMELGLQADAECLLALDKSNHPKCILLKACIRWKNTDNESCEEGISLPDDFSPERAFVNEPVLVDFLEQNRATEASGIFDYLLGNLYYAVQRKEDAGEAFYSAFRKGFRYTVLLRNLGLLHFRDFKDPGKAAGFLEEDLSCNGGKNEQVLNLLDEIYKAEGKDDCRKQLLPYLRKAVNQSLVNTTICDILIDSGQEELALEMLETEEFENWENRESSGGIYQKAILKKAAGELSRGNFPKALEWIEKVHNYPERLNYGESATGTNAEAFYYEGVIRMKNGQPELAEKAFRRGAKEMGNRHIGDTEKCRRYATLCAAALQGMTTGLPPGS